MKKEKVILCCFSFFDEKPFLQGQNSKEFDKNPHKKNTNSWYNWNKGKNSQQTI